jgi:hypothetical protein
MMRLRAFIILSLFACLFAGAVFAQSNGSDPVPEPTPTLSPRALVGIFQTLKVNYGLELDSDTGFASYPAVSAFIQLFSRQYLGVNQEMPYSSGIYVGYMGYDQFSRMVYFLLSRPASKAFEEYVYAMFDKHYLIASVGLRKDGFAIVYTDRCVGPSCNTPREQMNWFQDEAFAIYGLYVPGNVEDDADALDLIQQTFPTLSTLDFSPLGIEEGRYNFRGQTTASIYGVDTPLTYYVGTINIPRYTLVYAFVGVGEDAATALMGFPS